MEEFGKPLVVISDNKPFHGVGLFSLITAKNNNSHNLPQIEKINLYDKKKYSVWVYCYKKINQIEKIIDNTDEFLVISGFFDDQIKCWRLIVAKTLNQTNSEEPKKNEQTEPKNENLNNINNENDDKEKDEDEEEVENEEGEEREDEEESDDEQNKKK